MLTFNDIQDLRRSAEAYWKALHSEMEADYLEVDLGPDIHLTVQDQPVSCLNPHTAANKVGSACNHLIDADLEIRVDSGAKGKAQRERGEAIAAALKVLHYHLTVDAKSDPHRGALHNAANMGMGVWYVNTDFSRLLSVDARKPKHEKVVDEFTGATREETDDEYDAREDAQDWKEERARTLPLVFDHEDPRRIFPDPGTHGDLYVAKMERRLVGDIRRHWRGWAPQKKRGGKLKTDWDEVEWFELWSAPGGLSDDDPGSYYYEADGIPIKRFGTDSDTGEEMEYGAGPWPHGLDFCPYVVWDAGYGLPDGKPESVYKGIVRNPRKGGLFRAKAEKRTQLHRISDAAAWHAWAVPEGYEDRFEMGLNAINPMPVTANGEMIVPRAIVGPAPPQWLLSESAALEADINAETISDVLSAPGESGADVALLYARMVQEAAMALGPLKRNAERAYNRVWDRLCRILANDKLFGDEDEFRLTGLDSKGNATTVELNRKLFRGRHVFATTVDPRFATDQIGRTQSGLAQVAAGTIDRVTHHREYSGLDNPEQLVVKADADAVRRRLIGQGFFDDFAKAFASGKLAKDIKGRDWLQAKLQAEEDTANAVQGQEPGPPGALPGAPPNMAGMPSPSQGPQMVPSARQAPGAPGAALVSPGGALVEVGASDALSEQMPARGRGGFG